MMTYEHDKENSIIHLYASGVLVINDPINYFKQLHDDTSFIPKAEERVYFTDLQDIEFSYSGVIKIRDAFEKYKHGEKVTRVVFITDSDLSFAMARMVISVFGDAFPEVSIERID